MWISLATLTLLLTSVVTAAPPVPRAIQDLQDLTSTINAAAARIATTPGHATWDFLTSSGSSAAPQTDTAGLVQNVTMAILRAKWAVDTDKASWLAVDAERNGTNATGSGNLSSATPESTLTPMATPTTFSTGVVFAAAAAADAPTDMMTIFNTTTTLNGATPFPASLLTSSTSPFSTSSPSPNPSNTTALSPFPTPSPPPFLLSSLSAPYTPYILTLSTLATALSTLGRTWHIDLNAPVRSAISSLQESLSAFSTSLLAAGLIDGPCVLRTIRASGVLEDAKGSWGRGLNLPGGGSGAVGVVGGDVDGTNGVGDWQGAWKAKRVRRNPVYRGSLRAGEFYTHKDLWGREAEAGSEADSEADPEAGQRQEGKTRLGAAVAQGRR